MKKQPFVSICTPTFNRRPFIKYMIMCFENQTYPKHLMEWIIIDDGTDKIEDLVSHVPQIKYFKYDTKMTLGRKRNLAHEKCGGDIIVFMDDDDYYPPERVSHAVEVLRSNPQALCAGSSEMHLYFKHIHQMYRFGPYGQNHSTAATFAFRRELLNLTRFEDNASVAEERFFLKEYSIPFVQLDPMKSILVFSHAHNSFDKKILLESPNQFMGVSDKKVGDFIKEEPLRLFFMEEVDELLRDYEPGRPEHKPEVLQQIEDLKEKRAFMMEEYQKQQQLEQQQQMIRKMNDMTILVQELTVENNLLKNKNKYLEDKMSSLIKLQIQERKKKENI
jgi:glycosyltransferase involved in cell wall biosynthesis